MTAIVSVDHRLTQTDGKLVGYARVSTDDQDCAVQLATLKRLGCKKIYADKLSGRQRDRAQLAACLDYLREGDVLAITRVDRLGRSLADLIKIADELRQRDVSLYLAQQNIDTATPMGQMFYAMGVRGVRAPPPARAAGRGHHPGQGRRQVQGPQALGRCSSCGNPPPEGGRRPAD